MNPQDQTPAGQITEPPMEITAGKDLPEHLSDPKLDAQYQKIYQEREQARGAQSEERNLELEKKTGITKWPMTRAIATAASPGLSESQMDAIDTAEKSGGGLTEDQMNAIESAEISKPPKPIDPTKINGLVNKNLDAHLADVKAKSAPAENAAPGAAPAFKPPVDPKVEEATGFIDAIQKTFGASNIGIVAHGGLPTQVLPEQGDMLYRIVGQLGMLPDLVGIMAPAAIAGAAVGGLAGTIQAPIVGTIGGAAAGGAMNAWGTEAALRQFLSDAYKSGSAKEWKDAWPSIAANFIKSYAKGAVTGLATELAGVGGAVTTALSKAATMTVVGSALEGRMPTLSNFTDAAVLFLGMHAIGSALPADAHETTTVAGKLHDIWAKTGTTPDLILEAAKDDPALQQQILSTNIKIPESLKGLIDPKAVEAQATPEPEKINYKPKNTSEVLGDGFRPANGVEIESKPSGIPGGMSKEEYLASGESLFHGTDRPFENFQQNAKSRKWNNETGGMYFTGKSDVAHRFSMENSGSMEAINNHAIENYNSTSLNNTATLGDLFPKIDPKFADDEHLTPAAMKSVADEALDSGKKVFYYDKDGALQPYDKNYVFDQSDADDGGIKIFKKGHEPRVINANVHGASIDLSSPTNFPADLIEKLRTSQNSYDQSLSRIIRDYKDDPSGFRYQMQGNYQLIPNSPVLKAYAAENGIGKIHMPDAYESGFKSTYVPDVKHIDYGGKGYAAEMRASEGSLERVTAPGGEEVPAFREQIVARSGRKPEIDTSKNMQLYLDSLHPLKDLTKILVGGKEAYNAMSTIDNPYALAELVRSSESKATAFMQEGPREFHTHELTGTPSLMKTIKSIPNKDFEAFRDFRVAATNLERHDAGIPTGIQIEGKGGARETFENGKERFEKPLLDITKFHNESFKYIKDAQVISQDAYDSSLAKWKYYSPMFQDFENNQSGTPGVGGKGLQVKQLLHELKGKESGAKIVDPFESDVNITMARIKVAERNRALLALKKLQTEATELHGEHAEQLVQDVPTEGPKSVTSEELQNPNASKDNESGKVSYFENGERKTMVIPDVVADAIKNTPYQQMGSIGKLAMIPVNVERFGAIHNFPFPVRHIIRSEFISWMNSQHWWIPPGYRVIHGMYHQLMDTKLFSDAKFDGALQASLEAMDKNYVSKNIFELSHKTGLIDGIQNIVKSPAEAARLAARLAVDSVRHPIDAITAAYNKTISGAKHVVETAVNAPKVSEYATIIKRGQDESLKARLDAAYKARNINADGTRMGASPVLRALSQFTPFYNLRLQSKAQFIDNLTNRPTSTLLKGGSMALMSAALWYLNKDDEDVKQTSDYVKDFSMQIVEHNWQPATSAEADGYPAWRVRQGEHGFEIDHKVIHRLPVPWDQGLIFMSATARALQARYDMDKKEFGSSSSNEHAWDGFGTNLFKQLALDLVPLPAPLLPPLEHLTNFSTLTGNPVIPVRLQKIDHDEQATDYTSQTFQEIGHALGSLPPYNEWKKHGSISLASPIAEQHLWESWTGGLGKAMLGLLDHTLAKQGVYPLETMPQDDLKDLSGWTRAFEVKFPSMQADTINRLYYRMEASEHVQNTIKYLNGQFKPIQGLEVLTEQLKETGVGSLGKANETIQGMAKMANLVRMDKQAKPSDKQQTIDKLTYAAIQSAENANKIFDAFEKAAREHKPEFDEMMRQLKEAEKSTIQPIKSPQSPGMTEEQMSAAGAQPPQQQQAPAQNQALPSSPSHVKSSPKFKTPIPGTNTSWQNPALAPTHPVQPEVGE